MSRTTIIGWVLAALVIFGMGLWAMVAEAHPVAYYAVGVFFGWQWAWTLKGSR